MNSALQVLNGNNKVSEWAARITECRNSGLSVREWCEANHLFTQTEYSALPEPGVRRVRATIPVGQSQCSGQ